MQKLTVLIIFQIFFLTFPSFSQTKDLEIANDYFAKKQFDSAFDKYRNILKSNPHLCTKDRYYYYLIKFQLAECKRELEDNGAFALYKNLVKEHYDSLVYKNRRELKDDPFLDGNIQLFIAKCLYYTNDFRSAVGSFEYCTKRELRLNNYEKSLFAISLYHINRYKESVEILEKIEANKFSKKQVDSLVVISKGKFEEKIIDTINFTDTALIKAGIYGCYGHTEIEVTIYGSDNNYYECLIKKTRGYDSSYSKIHFHKSNLKKFMDFEKELKLHNYKNGFFCTSSSAYEIKKKDKKLKLEFFDGCGTFWDEFDKLLKDILPF